MPFDHDQIWSVMTDDIHGEKTGKPGSLKRLAWHHGTFLSTRTTGTMACHCFEVGPHRATIIARYYKKIYEV